MNERMIDGRDDEKEDVIPAGIRKPGYYWVRHKKNVMPTIAYWYEPVSIGGDGWWDWDGKEKDDTHFDYISSEPIEPPNLEGV